MKRKLSLTTLVIALLLTTACIHKASGPVTPWERVTAYNAALAQANNTVEQGAEAVANSGLATPMQVSPIVNATGQVATLHIQVTAVLNRGTVTQANLADIKVLVDQIKASVNAVPVSALGIKNPKSQQSFAADLNNLGTLADAVLSSLQLVVKP